MKTDISSYVPLTCFWNSLHLRYTHKMYKK